MKNEQQREAGRIGGGKTSLAKAAASRRNGSKARGGGDSNPKKSCPHCGSVLVPEKRQWFWCGKCRKMKHRNEFALLGLQGHFTCRDCFKEVR